MSSIGERILLTFSRSPETGDYPTTTENYTLNNALDFARRTVPDLCELVRGRSVLDYGCGPGWQAVALHKKCGARRVVGVDINESWLSHARDLARQENCEGAVTFARSLPREERFDVVLSLNAFEHFLDPARELSAIANAAAPEGRIVISFAEPWYSHSGAHASFFTRVPWVNVFFSEETVMRVRSRFRSDGAQKYEEVEGGLNRMTLRRFEGIIAASHLKVELVRYHATKRAPLVTRIPLFREFLTSAVTCILRK